MCKEICPYCHSDNVVIDYGLVDDDSNIPLAAQNGGTPYACLDCGAGWSTHPGNQEAMKEEISVLTQKLNQARQKKPAIPEGFVLVPIQPNEAMLDVILNTHDVYGFAADLYKALLDAAKETEHGN